MSIPGRASLHILKHISSNIEADRPPFVGRAGQRRGGASLN